MDKNEKKRKAVAIGDFDGMHLAHKTVVTGAKDVVIYCVNNKFSLLQKSIFQKRFPNVVFADFDKIKCYTGEEFIDKVLIEELHAETLLCGFNFRFGKNASWSALDMRNYCEEKGIWVRILEHLDFENQPISSTRIRLALTLGDVENANKMLGYNFCYESKVEKGDQRGRTIDFPTINQKLPDGLIVPKYGVYESRTFVNNQQYKSFTNIGIRPSFKVNEPLAETHIFNFCGDLYNTEVRVELVKYLREEKFFSSVEELKKQLEYDKSSII